MKLLLVAKLFYYVNLLMCKNSTIGTVHFLIHYSMETYRVFIFSVGKLCKSYTKLLLVANLSYYVNPLLCKNSSIGIVHFLIHYRIKTYIMFLFFLRKISLYTLLVTLRLQLQNYSRVAKIEVEYRKPPSRYLRKYRTLEKPR